MFIINRKQSFCIGLEYCMFICCTRQGINGFILAFVIINIELNTGKCTDITSCHTSRVSVLHIFLCCNDDGVFHRIIIHGIPCILCNVYLMDTRAKAFGTIFRSSVIYLSCVHIVSNRSLCLFQVISTTTNTDIILAIAPYSTKKISTTGISVNTINGCIERSIARVIDSATVQS